MAILGICLATFFITCKERKATASAPNDAITAKPLAIIVPGFKFPEDSATILSWLNRGDKPFDMESIYKHAWGIWVGLTAPSGEHYKDQKLLVFETWPGITDIQTLIAEGKTTDCPQRHGAVELAVPHQLSHGGPILKETNAVDKTKDLWVTVSYDPTAACFTTKNQLLDSAVLAAKLKGGVGSIPAFPKTAITIKPTFLVGKQTDELIEIPAWPGPPNPAKDFPSSAWNSYVYIDVKNGQPAGKTIVPTMGNNPTPEQKKAATCNLSDFIYFKVDSAAAAYIRQQEHSELAPAKAGDLAILVCMHVATKEISNWTWQTFFWTADPANPYFPSDKLAASLRPKELVGAASHYAVSTAYAMVYPNQPIYNGTNTGVSAVIGYNPYLEPGLGKIDFVPPNKLDPNFMYGVQSNCMSCHALAVYGKDTTNAENGGQPYMADQYMSLNDPYFKNTVQLDFAWSIQGNLFNRLQALQPAAKK